MAGLTRAQFAELVFRLVAGERSEAASGVYIDDIIAAIPDARRDLARLIYADPVQRHLLSRPVTVPLVGGVADISGADFDDLILASLPKARVTHDSTPYRLDWVPSAADLDVEEASDFASCALENRAIVTRDTDGKRDGLTGSLTIANACFVPAIGDTSGATTLAPELNHIFVDLLAKRVTSARRAPAAPPPA